jgi:cytochrome c oxidase subunit 2
VPPLRPHADTPTPRWVRRLLLSASALGLLVLSACSGLSSGYLPKAEGDGQFTSETARVITLWNGTWIAALGVGAIVAGLLIYAMIRFRRRSDDAQLPPQVKYNVPIEVMFTVIPVLMVGVLFYYTARDESALMDVSQKPDVQINVVAKRWSWDFNYVDSDVYESGVHTEINTDGTGAPQPVLYLPVGKRVEFTLNSRDVIHSFWVPVFLQKLDMIPGKTNKLQITPTQVGEFQGKCAELCGAYHAYMLFKVKVVPQAEYDAEMARLKSAGQVGQLSVNDSPEQLVPGDELLLPTPNGSAS